MDLVGDTDPKLLQVRTTTIQLIALLTSVHEPLLTAPIYNDCKGAR